jgi:hypothetical protein
VIVDAQREALMVRRTPVFLLDVLVDLFHQCGQILPQTAHDVPNQT